MRISREGRRVVVRTPAKVNLFLEVLRRRDDGFHDISTVMCPISLCDTLALELTDTPKLDLLLDLPSDLDPPSDALRPSSDSVVAVSNGDTAWDIPADDRNLVLQGLAQLRQRTGFKGGARVELTKRIPASAGLGGGSSNAAGAIVALLVAMGQWDRTLATETAKSLGSDIPFFLGNERFCGLAVAEGRGEQCKSIDGEPDLRFVVTHPPKGCSTAEIYGGLQADYLRNHHTPHTHGFLVAACQSGELEKIGAGLFNALQSTAVKRNPWIERQLDILNECGGPYRLMSGSGSSCFAVLVGEQDDSEVHRRVVAKAHNIGIRRVYSASAFYSPSIEQQIREWAS
ncbi:MAG: 4-(cytidine 5'-diphospho)-2-C-methyl-D-erythritol kinase [Aureliella sp.]